MEGRLLAGDGSRVFDGAALDSRQILPGQLFFALAGERTDGHRFVGDAGRRGAAGAVVHREDPEPWSDMGLIRVEDTYDALHALTRHVRQRVPERLVAITGSVGKTTTKELLATLLSRRFRCARNPGNLNNLFGFPLALLNIPEDTEWMVAEMGMSTPGELGRISRLGRPDVAVFTCIREAHLELFGTLRRIAEAKAELLEGLREDGRIVANAADPEVVRIALRHRETHPEARVIWYRMDTDVEEPRKGQDEGEGIEAPDPDYRATGVSPLGDRLGHRLRLRAPRGDVSVELPLLGLHNVENFLAAAATAAELGVPLDEIAAAAAELAPAKGRGEVHRLAGGVLLVDDSYNSNPAALSRALEGTALLPGRRRWAVLGDMLELGPAGEGFHRQAGEEAARRGFDPVIGVGELSRELVHGAERESGVRWFATTTEAAEWAVGELRDGDVVLVKGSRGIGLEAVVERLKRARGDG